jgi:hypothetical protein
VVDVVGDRLAVVGGGEHVLFRRFDLPADNRRRGDVVEVALHQRPGVWGHLGRQRRLRRGCDGGAGQRGCRGTAHGGSHLPVVLGVASLPLVDLLRRRRSTALRCWICGHGLSLFAVLRGLLAGARALLRFLVENVDNASHIFLVQRAVVVSVVEDRECLGARRRSRQFLE